MNDYDPTGASAHPGPPPYVPLSAGAVLALVLAIVLVVGALVGPVWCEALPLVIALASLGPISRGVRRGRAVAIVAIVFALAGAAAGWFFQRAAISALSGALTPVIRDLARDDRAAVARWAGSRPDLDAAVDRWMQRSRAATAAAGALEGDLGVTPSMWGRFHGLTALPAHGEEFEPKGAAPPEMAFWFRATCTKGDVWVAFDFGKAEKLSEAMSKARSGSAAATPGDTSTDVLGDAFAGKVEEIRFFR